MPVTPFSTPVNRPLHDFWNVAMPAQDALEFHHELEALIERFKAAAQQVPDLPRYIMHIGFVEDAG